MTTFSVGGGGFGGGGGGGGYEDRGDCVFVAGLPPSASEQDIAEFFGAIGIVKVELLPLARKLSLGLVHKLI